MCPTREELLDEALSKGSGGELPPNHPQGLLGDRAPDLRQPDDWTPDGSSGLSQETDYPVVLMGIVLAYLVFFPLAFVLLWRSDAFDRRRKVVLSCIMAAGVLAVTLWAIWS